MSDCPLLFPAGFNADCPVCGGEAPAHGVAPALEPLYAIEYYNSPQRRWLPRIRCAGTRELAEARMREEQARSERFGRLDRFRLVEITS